jgi:adenosylcobinamide-phosphate synthase
LQERLAAWQFVNFIWHLPIGMIAAAVALDLALGDPPWMPHPVRAIGAMIEWGGRRGWTGLPARDLRNGVALTIAVVLASIAAAWIAISACALIAQPCAAIFAVVLAWTTIALRGLDGAASTVQRALEGDDLAAARAAMPALVGREPQSLDRDGMVRATVESVAENSSDGVIAPLMYLFIGGPAAAMAYKAINTLDSMIGHTDARYLYFGRCAARVDDFANLIPARLSAACLFAAAAILQLRPLDAVRVCLADARRHPSPNAGFPEAAMAGALGIQLGGVAVYDGEPEMRPLIGAARRPVEVSDIAASRRMLWVQCAVAFIVMAAARTLIVWLWTR